MADARRFNEFMGGNRFRRLEYRRLARQAVALGVPPGGKALDLGTGPGFVAVEVARLLQGTGCDVVGVDLSSAMLAIAAENAENEGLEEMVTWRQGDAKALPFDDGEFDLIVCNPPYVSAAEYETLEKNVKDYEPRIALFAGDDGLDIYRQVVEKADQFLKPGAALMLEIGYAQGVAVRDLLEHTSAFGDIIIEKDFRDNDRIVTAIRIST